MGRTLVLRKCGEHEDCQLQQLDGGEWRHTAARMPLAQRLAKKPEEVEELERRLSGEVGRAIDLRVRLGERLVYLEDRLRHLEDSMAGLPLVKRLHDEAERLNKALSSSHQELQGRANRLERDVDRLTRFTEKLEAVAHTAEAQGAKAEKDAAAAAETAVHLGERIPRLDSTLAQSDDLIAKLAKADQALRAVADAELRWRGEVESIQGEIREAVRLINKEREERLAGYEKVQRQLREVNRG